MLEIVGAFVITIVSASTKAFIRYGLRNPNIVNDAVLRPGVYTILSIIKPVTNAINIDFILDIPIGRNNNIIGYIYGVANLKRRTSFSPHI